MSCHSKSWWWCPQFWPFSGTGELRLSFGKNNQSPNEQQLSQPAPIPLSYLTPSKETLWTNSHSRFRARVAILVATMAGVKLSEQPTDSWITITTIRDRIPVHWKHRRFGVFPQYSCVKTVLYRWVGKDNTVVKSTNISSSKKSRPVQRTISYS